MELELLRQIGKKIFDEISRNKPQLQLSPLGKGASGDVTFPVDKVAEDIILETLDRKGLNFNIISEERGFKIVDSSISVIIDPIDGSKNAISGIPFFSTSIAFADGERLKSLKLGYIINLINGDEFWAIKGKGAFMNEQKIKTKNYEKPLIVAFESSTPYQDLPKIFPLLRYAHRVRCFGSTALDLAYLASGALNIFVALSPSRIFDFSAGVLIAREAGALISDLEGNPIDELRVDIKTKTTLLACATETVYKKALALIK